MNKPQYYVFLNDNFKSFIDKVFETEKITSRKIVDADKTIDIMYNIATDYKGMFIFDANDKMAPWFEILVLSSYLYYATYNPKKPLTSLFRAREEYSNLATEYGINVGAQDFIFENIECSARYENSTKLKVSHDSPGECFVQAIWLFKMGNDVFQRPGDVAIKVSSKTVSK